MENFGVSLRFYKLVILCNLLIVSTCWKVWCLSTCKKSTSSLPSFVRYYKDITNLLFWILWDCLARTVKTILSACRKLWCLFLCKKLCLFLTSVFLEILQRYCKLVILSNMGLSGHTHHKRQQQLLENSIYKPKIILIPQFVLDILHFKESCNLIGQKDFGR